MGVIRGGALFVVVVLLFWTLFAGNALLTMSMSLDYDVIQPQLSSSIKEVLNSKVDLTSEIDKRADALDIYCENASEDFVFAEMGYTFEVPCEVVPQGSDAIVDYLINDMIEKSYYQEYDCDFITCVREMDLTQPFVLVSAKAKDYWKGKFYLSLIISLVLVVIMFFLIEKKFNLPITVGAVMILSSLPFMKLNSLLGLFTNEFYLQFMAIFFSKFYTVFLVMITIGIILLALGLSLRFFKFGFWVSGLFEKIAGKSGEKKVVGEVKSVPVVKKKAVHRSVYPKTYPKGHKRNEGAKKVVGK